MVGSDRPLGSITDAVSITALSEAVKAAKRHAWPALD